MAIAFPKAKVHQNVAGKPRKGSFEVHLVVDGKKRSLFSKLNSFGPQKDRSAIPDPTHFVANEIKNAV